MFQWTDEIMAFREDAENYTRFDEAIAGRVACAAWDFPSQR